MTRLANKRCHEMTKHLRKFRHSGKEPAKKIRIEASSQDVDREPSSKPIFCAAPSRGKRNKIFWHHLSLTWKLFLIRPKVLLVDYIHEHDLSLSIPLGLNKDQFEKAKVATYITAVKVWNALDTSNRLRIRLPANMDEDTNCRRSSTTRRVPKTRRSATGSRQASLWV